MEHPLSNTLEAEQDIPQAENPMLRLSVVPRTFSGKPRDDINRNGWFLCTPKTVPNFSAVAYYFGREIQKRTGVPIGVVQCSWYGTSIQVWTSLRAFEANPIIKQDYDAFVTALPKEYADWHDRAEEFNEAAIAKVNKKAEGKIYFYDPPPTGCYNAMVNPLTKFPIKGVIWYQGESDAPRHDRYAQALSIMAKDWREAWGQGVFPFLYVQIGYCKWWASTWAPQCEAQQKAETLIPNSAMVVMGDLHDNWDQHPRCKKGVGERLALAARARVYGEKDVAWRAPRFKSASVEGSLMRLTFDDTGGKLEARGDGALSGFSNAGEDGKYQPAEAKIDGDTIIVSS
jgi:sialate O-acetylesterase